MTIHSSTCSVLSLPETEFCSVLLFDSHDQQQWLVVACQGLPYNSENYIMQEKLFHSTHKDMRTHRHTHHTHNRFMALLDSVQDYPGEPAPERIYWSKRH